MHSNQQNPSQAKLLSLYHYHKATKYGGKQLKYLPQQLYHEHKNILSKLHFQLHHFFSCVRHRTMFFSKNGLIFFVRIFEQ